MGTWWNRFLVWLGISEPKARKEELEDWITANAAEIIKAEDKTKTDRGFRSSLADDYWYKRAGKSEKKLKGLPVWADFEVNVYEAPIQHSPKRTRMGYTNTYRVTEADGSVWTLTIEPGAEKAPEWVEVPNVGVR